MSIKKLSVCALAAFGLLSACSQKNNKVSEETVIGSGLVPDREMVDFGEVEMGEILSRRVKLKNESGKEVHITEVKTSCECTQPMVSVSDIAAGETATVEVMLDTHGLIGRQYHKVTLRTDADTCEIVVLAEIK